MLPVLLTLAIAGHTTPPDSSPGLLLLRRMQAAHATSWYQTIALDKRATFSNGSRTRHDAWVDVVEPPGRRRLDLSPLDSADATLFVRDSLFDVRHGAVERAMPFTHLLTILQHDAHVQPVRVTARQLGAAGIDLGASFETAWEGRRTIVVGARDPADRTSPQFWIDAERLVLVRLIEPRDSARQVIQETVLDHYERIGHAWYARRLVYSRNSQRFLVECVRRVQVDFTLPDGAWVATPWVRAPQRPSGPERPDC